MQIMTRFISIIHFNFKNISSHKIHFTKGDIVYLFSDGIVDQFGGNKGKKLFSIGFKQWLTDIYFMPPEQQKSQLLEYYNNWLNDYEQIDDILIMGIRL